MKKLYLSLTTSLLVTCSMAQTSDSLIAIDNNMAGFCSGHYHTDSKNFVTTDTLPISGVLGSSATYDVVQEEMFLCVDQGVARINARTGKLIDTMVTKLNISSLEADPSSGNVIGLYSTPWELNIYSIDPSSKNATRLSTLTEIDNTFGRPTMNTFLGKFYLATNLGITTIDANTGNRLDTIYNPKNIQAIEFHPGTQLIYGIYQDGTDFVFCSLDPATKTYTDIGVLTGVTSLMDISSMDIMGSRYLVKTNLGIIFIDLQDASISNPLSYTLFAFEYINKISGPASIGDNPETVSLMVYPNPSRGEIQVDGIEPGTAFEIWNNAGQMVLQGALEAEGIKLETLNEGFYHVRFGNGTAAKFILRK